MTLEQREVDEWLIGLSQAEVLAVGHDADDLPKAPVDELRNRFPIGFSPGQNRFAIVWLMMTTPGETVNPRAVLLSG